MSARGPHVEAASHGLSMKESANTIVTREPMIISTQNIAVYTLCSLGVNISSTCLIFSERGSKLSAGAVKAIPIGLPIEPGQETEVTDNNET